MTYVMVQNLFCLQKVPISFDLNSVIELINSEMCKLKLRFDGNKFSLNPCNPKIRLLGNCGKLVNKCSNEFGG